MVVIVSSLVHPVEFEPTGSSPPDSLLSHFAPVSPSPPANCTGLGFGLAASHTVIAVVMLESCWGVLLARACNTTTGWSAGASASRVRVLCVDVFLVQVTVLISVLIPGFRAVVLCSRVQDEGWALIEHALHLWV